ncbi:serine hydrolase [Dyadobacter sp. SG02]|uniref:serine hydrolase domain-containing protein n=1 Tax=Dyadobacter sp. SG02 TaxID=1855291 RepID=UPI000B899850|nr:serine hydrolase domain-containing protein [Dyadobacter sp. SG02]
MVTFLRAIILLAIMTVGTRVPGQTRLIKTVTGRELESGQLDQFIRQSMDSLQIPGLSIAIINDAQMVYHRTFGVKNIDTKMEIDSNTIFEAASLSKPLFSYFVMKQIEKGVIGLDDPLYKYMPHPAIKDNDSRYELITPRMVLSHTTGFPNWSVDKPIEMKFTPGTGFSYSGEAHQYLTALLAVIQHTNWQHGLDSIFQKDVSAPLGMKRSFYVRNAYTTSHKATGYFKNGKAKDFWLDGSISFGGAHTLHTEAADYARFLIAMINGKGLRKETFDEMMKEQIHFPEDSDLSSTGQTGWCLGFAMKPMPYGVRYLHTGSNSGFQSYCCFNRETKYGLVLFTNCEKAFELYALLGKYLDDEF